MRILIAGGAGFLGSHLVDQLLARGDEVMVVDDFSTGEIKNLPIPHSGFRVQRRDIRDGFDNWRWPKFDQIYNLACPASPKHYQADPIKTLETNVIGMRNVLELARKWEAQVLQASTSEIYGDPLEHPQRENYFGNVDPQSVRACYDEGKRAAETLCADYRRRYGVSVAVVRIFNTYGPRMAHDDGRVVSNFITAGLEGRPLVVSGDGNQTRSFCYVGDMIDGLIKAMEVGSDQSINLGNPHAEMSVGDLAKLIRDMTGGASPIVPGEAPESDPRRRRPDISRAVDILGWWPKTSLREGLVRTIEWFSSQKQTFDAKVAIG